MEQMTINYGKHQVSLRVYEWEREAMQRAARKMGATVA
jgi:hypothetical protein